MAGRHPDGMSQAQHTAAQKPTASEAEAEYQPDCSKRQNAALCAQRRMAAVAEKTIFLSTFQIILGVLGASLLLLTLYYTRHATNAAVDAATASAKSADTAERALISTQRAFVFLKEAYATAVVRSAATIVGGKLIVGWDVHVVWENAGSTPTQHLTTYKSALVLSERLPDDFDFPDIVKGDDPKKANRTFIGPKAIKETSPTNFPVEVIRQVHAGQHLYMWGWAEYGDVFRPNKRSRSEFCFEVLVTGKPDQIPDNEFKPPFLFVAHDKHNGCDDECYRKPGDPIPILHSAE